MAHDYPFDSELAAAVALIPPVDLSDLAAARAGQAREVAGRLAAVDSTGVEVGQTVAPGREGAPDVALRTYRPVDAAGPLPAVYSIHGGGFMLGSPDVDHAFNLRLCRDLDAVVVSPDYRLAPEHPFPAGLEDCYAGLCLLAKGDAGLEVAADRIAVLGDSSGAGMATALTMLAHARGGPGIRFQVLFSPALDDRLDTPSARAFTDTPVWTRELARQSWEAYLGAGVPGAGDVSPYAAPARAGVAGLRGLPPAYVAVMEFDPLRDEGIDYARALLAAGVRTELHLFPGTFHGAVAVEYAGVVRRMSDETVAVLRRALGR
ncbi:alpha/beta hydrolase [Streptomyces sp. NPDC059679]|uniref:alpha/beta hydrolase n=1 Tax=Streptomyces sp. NPDC059679 TaxID=3346903 RepID=UPI0036CF16EA